MSRIRTGTLFLAGLVALIVSSLVRVGVTALRPVKDATGAQLYRPDGRILMEVDRWGNIKVNWQSNLLLVSSAILLVWCLVRFLRSRLGGPGVS
jgi:hypothetical protein